MSGPLFPAGPSNAYTPRITNSVGTKVPNRIFIGGLPQGTTEAELEQCFARFGNIRHSKVIIDKGGQPKGYGFVTFETENEANAVLKEVELEGGSLPFKDRRLNVSEAVRKIPPVMHPCDVDQSTRLSNLSSQHPNRSVMSGMGSVQDPNLSCSLLAQLGAGMNDALSGAGLGLPCHGSSNSNPLLYNYFYSHPSSPMTPGYPMDVGMGYGSPFPGHIPPGSWPHPSDMQWVTPGQQQPMHSMMYPHQTAQGLLSDTPPPSDVSSWSSGGSCASSTCSTGSFAGGGHDMQDPAAAAAAQAMLPYFCMPDANGMMYLPYPIEQAPPPPSSVSLGPISGASLISPQNTANYSADEVDGMNEKLGNITEDDDAGRRGDVEGEACVSSAPASKSLAAKIRDRRKTQPDGVARMDTNNNCPRGGSNAAKETPVISVSKIMETSRSPSPAVVMRDDGTSMPSGSSSPSMLPKNVGPYLPGVQAYQYCQPSLAHHPQATGPISVNTSMASAQYPFHQHSQISQQPLFYGNGYPSRNQPGSFMYPGISPAGQGMPPYMPGMHQSQFGGQQQFSQPPNRRGWQSDPHKFRSGQQSNFYNPGPKGGMKPTGVENMAAGIPEELKPPTAPAESRELEIMVENMTVS